MALGVYTVSGFVVSVGPHMLILEWWFRSTLAIFQVPAAMNDPVTRTAAMISIVCATASLVGSRLLLWHESTLESQAMASRWMRVSRPVLKPGAGADRDTGSTRGIQRLQNVVEYLDLPRDARRVARVVSG